MVNEADGQVYEKHAEELIRFATGLVGPSDAPDVVSGAVLNCLSARAWPTLSNPRAYLFRAVLNEARHHHRSTGRRRIREERAAQPGTVDPPEVRPEVLEAVSRLSVRQRAVTVLTYWADLDPASIARLLDISEGSVRRHLARARAHLRETLHDDF